MHLGVYVYICIQKYIHTYIQHICHTKTHDTQMMMHYRDTSSKVLCLVQQHSVDVIFCYYVPHIEYT